MTTARKSATNYQVGDQSDSGLRQVSEGRIHARQLRRSMWREDVGVVVRLNTTLRICRSLAPGPTPLDHLLLGTGHLAHTVSNAAQIAVAIFARVGEWRSEAMPSAPQASPVANILGEQDYMIPVQSPPPSGQKYSAFPVPLLENKLPPKFELHEPVGAVVPVTQVAVLGLVVNRE